MFRTIARAFLMVVLCASIGGPLVVLQSVAWTTMILRSSQQVSLAQAVSQALDGNHACNLCKKINAAQHSQKKEMPRVPDRPDLICSTQPFQIPFSYRYFQYTESAVRIHERVQPPQVPPPRWMFA
jgi:hypothetical protein